MVTCVAPPVPKSEITGVDASVLSTTEIVVPATLIEGGVGDPAVSPRSPLVKFNVIELNPRATCPVKFTSTALLVRKSVYVGVPTSVLSTMLAVCAALFDATEGRLADVVIVRNGGATVDDVTVGLPDVWVTAILVPVAVALSPVAPQCAACALIVAVIAAASVTGFTTPNGVPVSVVKFRAMSLPSGAPLSNCLSMNSNVSGECVPSNTVIVVRLILPARKPVPATAIVVISPRSAFEKLTTGAVLPADASSVEANAVVTRPPVPKSVVLAYTLLTAIEPST